ncbi:MAG: 30S ribosomal protein S20 [Clostridia bacterium]
MPNIKSAKKRVDVTIRNRQINKGNRSELATEIKKFDNAVKEENVALAEQLLPKTFATIDEKVTKGTIHKNCANHKKATVASKLDALKNKKA